MENADRIAVPFVSMDFLVEVRQTGLKLSYSWSMTGAWIAGLIFPRRELHPECMLKPKTTLMMDLFNMELKPVHRFCVT